MPAKFGSAGISLRLSPNGGYFGPYSTTVVV